MKSIQPFPVWFNGANVNAEYLALKSTFDNLENCAKFYWQLFTKMQDSQGNYIDINGDVVSYGNMIMTPEEYEVWDDSNEAAYAWAAGKLNVVIIPSDPQPQNEGEDTTVVNVL
jgi:hypothetical protein